MLPTGDAKNPDKGIIAGCDAACGDAIAEPPLITVVPSHNLQSNSDTPAVSQTVT